MAVLPAGPVLAEHVAGWVFIQGYEYLGGDVTPATVHTPGQPQGPRTLAAEAERLQQRSGSSIVAFTTSGQVAAVASSGQVAAVASSGQVVAAVASSGQVAAVAS